MVRVSNRSLTLLAALLTCREHIDQLADNQHAVGSGNRETYLSGTRCTSESVCMHSVSLTRVLACLGVG